MKEWVFDNSLEGQLKIEMSKNEIIFIKTNSESQKNLENERIQLKLLLEKNYGKLSNMNVQEEYLRKTILMLELR